MPMSIAHPANTSSTIASVVRPDSDVVADGEAPSTPATVTVPNPGTLASDSC